jgi:integrase
MMKSAKLITAKDARKEALATLGEMAEGIDPNEKKRQARQQIEEGAQQAITLRTALNNYLNKANPRLKPRTVTTYQDLCRLYLSDWLDKPAANITRDMVKTRHSDIASDKRQRAILSKETDTKKARKDKPKLKAVAPISQKPKEAAADNCMRTLRAVLNYAFEDDDGMVTYANPVNVLSSRKRKAWFKVDRRRTLIKNSDLPAWYKAVMALDNDIARDYLLFLLFTGLRRTEIAKLKWEHVDLHDRCFTLIGGFTGVTKNKEYATLPLSDYLHALLTSRKERLKTELAEARAALADIANMTKRQQQTAYNRLALAESRLASPYVFPGEGKTGFIVEAKRPINEVIATTGIKFSIHDFRRTFTTLAESLDISVYAIKALVNHKQASNDVTGGYIILNTERLREPSQKIADAFLSRIKVQHGQLVQLPSRPACNESTTGAEL